MTDYGPQLPPGLRRPAPANDEDTAATAGAVGPQLPPESSRPAVAQEDSNTFGKNRAALVSKALPAANIILAILT